MSDTLADGTEPTEPLDPNIRAQLGKVREFQAEAESANQRAANLERELAFARAGVPDDARGQMFRRGYDGETDPEAIKSSYEDLFGQPQEQTTVTDAELETQRRVAQAGQGTTGGGTVDFADALRSASSEDAVMDLVRNAPEAARVTVPEVPF